MRCMLRSGRTLLAALATAVAAGCATAPAPVEQIRYFSQAFTAVDTIGQPLLDDLALAERAQGREIAERRAKGTSQRGATECPREKAPWQEVAGGREGFINGFCLADATFYTELNDPPATAAFRGALRVIARYADVLAALSEGRNVPQALGQVDALGQEVGGLLALAGVSTLPIAPVLGTLRPLLERAARESNAAEARRLILEGSPQITTLIAALRDAVPAMFTTLIEAPAMRLVRTTDAQAAKTMLAGIENRRVEVAQYVVLLDRLQSAWNATVAATRNPDVGRLASLVATTTELRTDAEALRRGLAALRAGTGAGR